MSQCVHEKQRSRGTAGQDLFHIVWLFSIFSLGGGMVGQGRLHHQGAGGSLHAEEVPDPEEKIL